MDQPVLTSSTVIFDTVNTGQGNNELYPMDQAVQSTDTPTFNNVSLDNVLNDNTENNILVWNATTKLVEYRTLASLPVVNPKEPMSYIQ